MFPNAAAPLLTRSLVLILLGLTVVFSVAPAWAADEARRAFDLPAGDATETLKLYASQAHREFIFPSNPLKGVHTNAVRGEFTPREAIDLLVANTGLNVVEDAATGILMINYNYMTLREAGAKANPSRILSDQTEPPNKSMNPTPARSLFATAAAVLSLGLSNLEAQTAPTSSQNSGQETAVKLDPFNVSAESDVGFVAASSLAGGRIATALKDTPVAYSVLTSEFLEAFNINDAGKAAEFSVNTNQYTNDGLGGVLNGANGSTSVQVRIRGQLANTPTRNFFPYAIAADSYNVDRIDFARGANASLFGAGGSAGTQNTVSKQALTTKTIREVRAQVGSWNRYRMSADVNQPITDKVAVRTNLLWTQGDTWRQREWERRKGIDFAATWNITPKFSVRAEYEYRTVDKNTGTNRLKDQTSAWDGKFMPSGPNAAMTAAQMAVAGVTRAVQRFVRDPDNLTTAMNIQNMFQTKGAAYNATATNFLNGQPIKSVGFTLNNIVMTQVWDHPDRFAATRAGSPFFSLPTKDFTPLWDVNYDRPDGKERGKDLSVYFTWRPFEGFFAELSGDSNKVDRFNEYVNTGGMFNTQMDINRLKADGTPNPYFLHGYGENSPFTFIRNPGYKSMNLQTAYVKDTRWGRLQAGVMAGIQNLEQKNRQYFFVLPLQNGVIPGADMRSFFETGDQNIQSVYTRQYSDLRGKLAFPYPTETPMTISDPTRGTRATLTPRWMDTPNRPGGFVDDLSKNYKFVQAVANMNLFKNHLVIIGAVRRDLTLLRDKAFMFSYDMPAGWDGTYIKYRPDAPADYWNLMYTPKDATGKATGTPIPAAARPRSVVNGVSLGVPQYANDRFQDDFSSPDIKSGVNTRTFGAVVNLTNWLGVYANDSTTFDLNSGSLDVRQQLIPPTSSQSYDAGVRVTLPNGKLNFSLGWYRAYQKGQIYNIGFNLRQDIGSISDAPVVGDLSEGGRNNRGLGRFSGLNVFSTVTSETKGLEVEMTANLTRSWRMVVNAGKNNPIQKDVMPDLPSWIAEKDAQLRLIIQDAGGIINAQNQASINPALNDPTKINVTRVQASIDAWNDYQTVSIPTILATNALASRQNGGPEFTANVATDYRFTSGRLNGLRAGIAINYRGRQILGARTADTIVNPANPAAAILDPTDSATNYLWAGGYAKGTANFSYTYRLKESGRRYAPKSIQFDLAIDNLFSLTKPVIETSATNSSTANGLILAPRNNDISNPSVVSIPGSYNFQPPRNYTLTAKFNF